MVFFPIKMDLKNWKCSKIETRPPKKSGGSIETTCEVSGGHGGINGCLFLGGGWVGPPEKYDFVNDGMIIETQ